MIPFDRRSPSGDVLADALLHAEEALCFDDLVEASGSSDVAEISAWLGHALQEGLVEEVAGPAGMRCFRVRSRGRRIMTLRRRGEA